jgi:hypothetical protein
MMFRASVLVVALLCTAPTIWAALGKQTVPVDAALLHFLIAVPIVAVLLGLVRMALERKPPARTPRAKQVDRPDGGMVD